MSYADDENMKETFFVKTIMSWGKKNYIGFPWRKTQNLYEIFVAEFLLQKTNSKMVEEVYTEFVMNYPTVNKLNETPLEEIKTVFEKIGLKYRAERMKNISAIVVQEYGSIFPDDVVQLLSFKGIGKYIANALLCFGYNKTVPIVDVDIARILVRFFDLHLISRPRNSKMVWDKAQSLLPLKDSKMFNWILLDFGASVCKSKPLCQECPLKEKCRFLRNTKNNIV